ncbi:MAG: asparagine synthase (glutamine-hydrolyzing) [Pseudomonadota bacterium]
MCGIAGIHAYHYAALPVAQAELRVMRDHMQLRGPDGKGEWFSIDGRIGLGHRRLAIIDLLERAAQPMHSADGQLVVSFNGEIYNYRQLRQQLIAKGYEFRTESDTEVLLHLYADKGTAMLADLRGMFAFALWDARKQATLLARDPYGIKPLYYADDGWTCRFASQVKALLASSKVSRTPEPAGIAGFYLFGSVPEPFTLYQEIRAVPAGAYLWITATGAGQPQHYFDQGRVWANAAQVSLPPAAEIPAFVSAALHDTVASHLVADVPVGAFLSAGIDSGALVGLMRDAGQQQIRTATLGFREYQGTAADEVPLAAEVARHYGVEHRVRMIDEAEFQQDLPAILAAMDQPSIDGINSWFVSKAAHEAGLKVAVSGVGGDELFGGYPSFRELPRWVRRLWLPAAIPGLGVVTEQLHAAFAPLFSGVNPKAGGMLRYGGSYAGAWLLKRGLFMPKDLPALLGEELAAAGLHRLQPLRHINNSLRSLGGNRFPHATIATLESSLYLRNQLLRDTDWASMAHSLEVRTPLVDSVLLQTLAPLLLRVRGNQKHLLAASPAKALPSVVADRAKTGFTTPVAHWQQRGAVAQHWQQIPLLRTENCPWARRWATVVRDAG